MLLKREIILKIRGLRKKSEMEIILVDIIYYQ